MAYRIENSVPQISNLNPRGKEQPGTNNIPGRSISLRPSGEPDKDFASLMTKKIRSLQGIVSSEFAFQNKLTGTYKVTHQDGSSFEGGIRDGLADGEGRTFDSGGRFP